MISCMGAHDIVYLERLRREGCVELRRHGMMSLLMSDDRKGSRFIDY